MCLSTTSAAAASLAQSPEAPALGLLTASDDQHLACSQVGGQQGDHSAETAEAIIEALSDRVDQQSVDQHSEAAGDLLVLLFF